MDQSPLPEPLPSLTSSSSSSSSSSSWMWTSSPPSLSAFLTTLPDHASQLVGASVAYFTLFFVVCPYLSSTWLAPTVYPSLPRRTRINWDTRVVAFVQSVFICACALHVVWTDESRRTADAVDRLAAYSPAVGRVQAFAAGYFIWDLVVCLWYLPIVGVGALVHAVMALGVTVVGFRPFANHYGINFVLYELSTPFLNLHWFLDKAGMTGTTAQLVNGLCLLVTFFACRILWGWYSTFWLYRDFWVCWVLRQRTTAVAHEGRESEKQVELWLALPFCVATTVLCLLNVYWFGLMVKAVRKRFA